MLPRILIFLPVLFLSCSQPKQKPSILNPDGYQRIDTHDGYVTGNSYTYIVAGLGNALTRKGKSFLSDQSVSLSRISWIVGPKYSFANLGFGWEFLPEEDRKWEKEEILNPEEENPFWGSRLENDDYSVEIRDIPLGKNPVILRKINLKAKGQKPTTNRFVIPLYTDIRNYEYQVWNGNLINQEEERWKPSLDANEGFQSDTINRTFLVKGVGRRLYWEPSIEGTKSENQPKYLMTGIMGLPESVSIKTVVNNDSSHSGYFALNLGEMDKNQSLDFGILIVTDWTEDGVKSRYEAIKNQSLASLNEQAKSSLETPIIKPLGSENQKLSHSINACLNLAKVSQAHFGGVFAQAYMYPMYYHRDMYGPFLVFMASGEYERAFDLLNYLIAMENQYGLQNAYDAVADPPGDIPFDPEKVKESSHFAKAEVPNFVILMARDYFNATGDLERIAPLYDRLVYNLRIQEVNQHHLLSYQGDESYTNFRETRPKFSDEMTDSGLLYLASVRFLQKLAKLLLKKADFAEFSHRYYETLEAMNDRLWLKEERHWAFVRDDSDSLENIDRRPAFDPLLRWAWLELGSPEDSIYQLNQQAVLNHLTDPIRVVPEWDMVTGMEPGYLLYSLARSQHPETHFAAELLMKYASDRGLFAEYYRHHHDTITTFSGTLRPWESSINGYAMIHYLLGYRPNISEKRIELSPHLPPGWTGWESREISMGEEGTIQFRLEKKTQNIVYKIIRKGGKADLEIELEMGLLGRIKSLHPEMELKDDIGKANLLLKPDGRLQIELELFD